MACNDKKLLQFKVILLYHAIGKFVDSLKSNDSVVTHEKSANDTHCNIKIRLDKSSMKKKSTKRYKKLKSKKTTLIEMQTKEDEGFQNCQGI